MSEKIDEMQKYFEEQHAKAKAKWHFKTAEDEAAYDFMNQEGFLLIIKDRVENGESLFDICREHNLSHSLIRQWIFESPERKEIYQAAVDVRESWLKDRVLDEYASLALMDMGECYDENGVLKKIKDMPPRVRAAMKGIDFTDEGTIKKITFNDKLKALESIAKMKGMLTEKVEHTGKFKLENIIGASFKEDNE